MQMADANNNLLWQPTARDGVPGQIFGYDLVPTEKTGKALGDEWNLILTNLRAGYAVGMRKEIAIDATNSAEWLTDQWDFRAILRIDGRTTWDKPITTESGKQLSWAVVLGDAE